MPYQYKCEAARALKSARTAFLITGADDVRGDRGGGIRKEQNSYCSLRKQCNSVSHDLLVPNLVAANDATPKNWRCIICSVAAPLPVKSCSAIFCGSPVQFSALGGGTKKGG